MITEGTKKVSSVPVVHDTVPCGSAAAGKPMANRFSCGAERVITPSITLTASSAVTVGSATLLLHDETFIKWKPTVLYWLFASVLSVSALIFRKNLIRTMLGEQIQLPDAAWNKLNLSWAGFFACMGFLNLYVAFNYPTDTWVNFKLFGGMGLMLAFVIGQGLFLAKYVEQKETE